MQRTKNFLSNSQERGMSKEDDFCAMWKEWRITSCPGDHSFINQNETISWMTSWIRTGDAERPWKLSTMKQKNWQGKCLVVTVDGDLKIMWSNYQTIIIYDCMNSIIVGETSISRANVQWSSDHGKRCFGFLVMFHVYAWGRESQ